MEHLKELYIVGVGGFGREVAWLVERINAVNPVWDLKGFIDDDKSIQGTLKDGYLVVGDSEYLLNIPREVWVVCAIGASKTRKRVVEKLSQGSNIKFATVIDPSVICSERVTIGNGTIICAGTIITVDISIGSHVIINLDCTIGHDDSICDYVTLYPSVNVSGNVNLGECVEIGTGTQIIQGKNVGKESIVGAGAVVVRDIPEKCTAVGCPAKPIKFIE